MATASTRQPHRNGPVGPLLHPSGGGNGTPYGPRRWLFQQKIFKQESAVQFNRANERKVGYKSLYNVPSISVKVTS